MGGWDAYSPPISERKPLYLGIYPRNRPTLNVCQLLSFRSSCVTYDSGRFCHRWLSWPSWSCREKCERSEVKDGALSGMMNAGSVNPKIKWKKNHHAYLLARLITVGQMGPMGVCKMDWLRTKGSRERSVIYRVVPWVTCSANIGPCDLKESKHSDNIGTTRTVYDCGRS